MMKALSAREQMELQEEVERLRKTVDYFNSLSHFHVKGFPIYTQPEFVNEVRDLILK